MKNQIPLTFFIFLVPFFCISQTNVNKEWQSNSGLPATVDWQSSATHPAGLTATVGNQQNGATADLYVALTAKDGTLLWEQTLDPYGDNDYGSTVAFSGTDLIVGGATFNPDSNDYNAIIARYDSTGVLLWSEIIDGISGGNDAITALNVSGSGHIFATGGFEGSGTAYDYHTMKLDGNGNIQWQATYDHEGLFDVPAAISVDAQNIVVVTGGSSSTFTDWDYATVKYDANGNELAVHRLEATGAGIDRPAAMKRPADGYIHVTGTSSDDGTDYNIRTIKLDPALNLEWTATYTAPGLQDEATGIDVDDDGNVYVSGTITDADGTQLMVLIAYDASGTELWVEKRLPQDGDGSTKGKDVKATTDDKVVIVGEETKDGNTDILAIQYDTDGDKKWEKKTDGGGNDKAAKVQLDASGDIYVTGKTSDGSTENYTTVKYSYKDRLMNVVADTSGNPIYLENELLVRLDTSALIHGTIDRDEYYFGKLEDFLRPQYVLNIREALTEVCNSDKCDITVYKIFNQLKTTINYTSSRLGETIRIPNFWATLLFEFPEGVDVLEAQEVLNAIDHTIKYAHPNLIASLDSPNNPVYEIQASLHPTANFDNAHINVEQAWQYETGKPYVKVGVFESGVHWAHEDFGDGTQQGTKVDGWNFAGNGSPLLSSTDPDPYTHGTRTAGIIGAIRNNSIGVAGIAGGDDPTGVTLENAGVSLFGLKVFDALGLYYYGGSVDYIANAIVGSAILDESSNFGYGLHIMNHSWGVFRPQSNYVDSNLIALKEASHFANRANVTFVASVGNNGAQQSDGIEPDQYPGTIDDDWILCVGGTGYNGDYKYQGNGSESNWFPSRHRFIDVAAPCDGALVTTTNSPDGYNEHFGVSAAVPHVSGVAALLMSYLNQPMDTFTNLAPEDVENILQLSADDRNFDEFPGQDSLIGYGLLDAGLALASVDTNVFHLSHFRTDSGSTISHEVVSNNQLVQLTERYKDPYDHWFGRNINYRMNIHKVSATVYHNLPALDTIVAYWPRPSSSTAFLTPDINSRLQPRERIIIDSLDNDHAYITGYFYEVSDTLGNFIGWWPGNPYDSLPDYDYSILHYDPLLPGAVEDMTDEGLIISAYPNPTLDGQTLSIGSDSERDVSISLYDLKGRAVKSIFSGNLNKGLTRIRVSLANIPNGIYIYQLISEDGVFQYKTIRTGKQ